MGLLAQVRNYPIYIGFPDYIAIFVSYWTTIANFKI